MEKLSVADVLDRAADLIEPEGAWTQHVFARDGDRRTYWQDSKATCRCIRGAVWFVAGSQRLDVENALEAVLPASGPGLSALVVYNDAPERTQPEVVAKLREAAAVARERGL